MHESFELIYEAYKKLIGEEFVYESPYGGYLRARISNIQIVTNSIVDPLTAYKIQKILSHKRGFTDPAPTTYEGPKWSAYKPQIYFITEKGNQYEAEKCYILDEDSI